MAMSISNRRWVILSASEAAGINFSEVMETSSNTLRWNAGETKTLVKFEGDTPSFLEGKTQYTQSEILAELEKPEWLPSNSLTPPGVG